MRRLKLKDLTEIPEFNTVVRFTSHLDTILVTNLVIWAHAHSIKDFLYIKRAGFLNNIETFIVRTSEVSSEVKRYAGGEAIKQKFSELNVLTGYLQNDIQQIDWQDELKQLAHGGAQHGLEGDDWLKTFQSTLDLNMRPGYIPQFTDFATFIQSRRWLTPGSSSLGKVQWSYKDDNGSFKARKNMLPEITEANEVLNYANNWDGELDSVAFTKDELSKRRIAVASNLEAYLAESYILSNVGHGYTRWEYITLDESPQSQHSRNQLLMSRLQNNYWALPFDFKAFDHQPTTDEIQLIVRKFASLVLPPRAYAEEWTRMTEKVVQSYAKSRIRMNIGDTTIQENVTGGLPSGVRFTSLIGNIWNQTMTTIARQYSERLLGYSVPYIIAVRGDDTYILSRRPVELVIFRMMYHSINARGLDSKFAICRFNCEFLRNLATPNEVRGWSNRSIPSITQRKPWNPQPWKPGSDVLTVADNIRTMERRLGHYLPDLHSSNIKKWEKYTGQSRNWLNLPAHMGGLGVYPYEGWLPSTKLPTHSVPIFTSTSVTDNVQLTWIQLDQQQRKLYNQVSLSAKIAADDVRGPQSHIGKEYVLKLRNLKTTWRKTEPYYSRLPALSAAALPSFDEPTRWPQQTSIYSDPPGTLPVTEFITQHQIASRISSLHLRSLGSYLAELYPGFYSIMKRLEDQGYHRTDAINITMGRYPTTTNFYTNPILTSFAASAIQKAGAQFWKGRRAIAHNLYSATNTTMKRIAGMRVNNMYLF